MNYKVNAINERWSLFFDIEGFSNFNKMKRYRSFDLLISTIYKIGSQVYPNSPDRLFVHHIGGDSIIIVSDFSEEDLLRPISIAIVLQRILIANNYIGKAGISVGDFADVSGTWTNFYKLVEKDLPKKEVLGDLITEEYDKHKIFLGDGLITLIPVLGDSLVNSYKTQKNGPRGPNIIVSNVIEEKVPQKYVKYKTKFYTLINWVSISSTQVDSICNKIGESKLLDTDFIQKKYENYLNRIENDVSNEWLENAKKLEEI
jgi:hypothetical protein